MLVTVAINQVCPPEGRLRRPDNLASSSGRVGEAGRGARPPR